MLLHTPVDLLPLDRRRRDFLSPLPSPARSPYISSRKLSFDAGSRWSTHEESNVPPQPPSDDPEPSMPDVLFQGDIVAPDAYLQGEQISVVADAPALQDAPASELEVVRRLGAGSYAVVYLVREVLSKGQPSDSGHSVVGSLDMEVPPPATTVYGKEYAIKVLSKADLDADALAAQMLEVTIHQSLRPHPNIVTLYRTLQTSSFLLLLLEYVPGEDLFYFLEQSRDHYDSDPHLISSSSSNVTPSRTPPTPGLLASSDPSQLLSKSRLRLVASMFSQMCEAVAACHAQRVFHRDIKPENFIVTDGWLSLPDGRRERKVVVKLTDFGLSTTDVDSPDMDCGSAPYMAYECRNNVAPTYKPRGADVWSLGIVLINMLYHHNPWSDTTQGACSSFERFRREPVSFFIQRFAGMTLPVAEKLAKEVFCILPNPADDSPRISAADLGAWARDLPTLLGGNERQEHPTAVSQVHPITVAAQLSHRPSSRNPSATPANRSPITRGPSAMSLEPLVAKDLDVPAGIDETEETAGDQGAAESRSSTNKRVRKRGARNKGKSSSSANAGGEDILDTLAAASQSLAREISRVSKASTVSSVNSRNTRFEPVSIYPLPSTLCSPSASPLPLSTLINNPALSKPPAPSHSSHAAQSVSKKPSKWKLSFGRTSGGRAIGEDAPISESPKEEKSATAANVSNIIMALNSSTAVSQAAPKADSPLRPRGAPAAPSGRRGPFIHGHESWAPSPLPPTAPSTRATSPTGSIRSQGQHLASSASSVTSSNWRSSISSSAGSTSAFTRYSNSSSRSISTAATSISANTSSSWRSNAKPPSQYDPLPLPRNIKHVTGTPWELSQAPREIIGEDGFGSPPQRAKRSRKPKDSKLDTINERPVPKPTFQRKDAATSTTDLNGVDGGEETIEGPKKVAKGQINALAKMLSALRR